MALFKETGTAVVTIAVPVFSVPTTGIPHTIIHSQLAIVAYRPKVLTQVF